MRNAECECGMRNTEYGIQELGARSGEVRTSVATAVFVPMGQWDSAQGFNPG